MDFSEDFKHSSTFEAIEEINKRLDRIEEQCEKMVKHIQFVESTYDSLRTPLSFIKTKIEGLVGTKDTSPLPKAEDRDSTPCLDDK